MPKLFLVAVTLLIATGQFSSCEQRVGEPVVIGWVEAKQVDRRAATWVITINHVQYDVPASFWQDVKIGDLVKWDGLVWTIVRRATSGFRSQSSRAAQTWRASRT